MPCSWIGRINFVKINMIHHTIYRPNAISIKLPMAYIPELEQNMVTICMQTHKIGKATLRKKKGKNREKKKKKKLEDSTFLTSKYTIKLWSSRQYDTDTKTEL